MEGRGGRREREPPRHHILRLCCMAISVAAVTHTPAKDDGFLPPLSPTPPPRHPATSLHLRLGHSLQLNKLPSSKLHPWHNASHLKFEQKPALPSGPNNITWMGGKEKKNTHARMRALHTHTTAQSYAASEAAGGINERHH